MNDPNQIVLGDWEFTYTERGEWISKALPFKSKPVHSEQPHYKVVNELEEKYERLLRHNLATALKDIVGYLNVS